MRQINPDVVAAFPITPSTEIPQYFSSFVSDGKVDTEFVAVESEHSAMSACIGASAAGGRAMTATSSAGLALMWEMLYIAAAMRLPVVMSTVNRALSGPLNIHNDHSDSMGARDSGWIQIYGENNQEAYDNFIQAVRIAEHPDVTLPVMNCFDGFITSHAVENIELIEDEKVREFVGDYTPEYYLNNKEKKIAAGSLVLPAHYMEHKRAQEEAMRNAKKAILEIAAEFEKMTGRKYEYFEEYMLDDAEEAIVVLNSTAGTAKAIVDEYRAEGRKVGLLKIRVFRPFPAEEIAKALAHVKAIAVMDKACSFNAAGGPVFTEVAAAMAVEAAKGKHAPSPVINFIYGLGGRDVKRRDIKKVFEKTAEVLSGKEYEVYNWLEVRE
jgi:pyruvate ferredoxin oxidoreductase alpha subunit